MPKPAEAVDLAKLAESEKRRSAEAAARLLESGMTVGLGTGTTVACLLSSLAARRLALVCVATSVATETEGRRLGLDIQPFDQLDRLDKLTPAAGDHHSEEQMRLIER